MSRSKPARSLASFGGTITLPSHPPAQVRPEPVTISESAKPEVSEPIEARVEPRVLPPRPVETVETIIRRVRVPGQIDLNDSQMAELLTLKLKNNEPLFSVTDRASIYEFLGLIFRIGFDKAIEFFRSHTIREGSRPFYVWETRREVIRDFPTLLEVRNKVIQDAGIFTDKIISVKGVFKCNKCGSEETTYYTKQVRSADEPETAFVTCVKCGSKWKS